VVIRKNGALHVRTSLDGPGEPVIIIEDSCVIGHHSMISAKNCIHLEPHVVFESLGLIQDHNHAFEDVTLPIEQQGVTEGGRIRIGEGCYIGHGAVILCAKGQLTLGRNCIVRPKALVTRSFPPYSVIAGIPANIIKQNDPIKAISVSGYSNVSEIGSALHGDKTAPVRW
jgi:lipopolysaccharide O-acetyltransferase